MRPNTPLVGSFCGFFINALIAVLSFNLRFLSGAMSGFGVRDSSSLRIAQPFDR